ncbi:TRCF domain-containing protein, partial [Nitrospirota bacterium]
GLLVIDEEHRFGVGQKEKVKELSHGVDVLAMSATPIPRSLQMSLSGIRTMSLIETPPEERQAVKSAVAVSSDALIRDAIGRELDRGGQVFFVHNRIKDIDRLAQKLKRLVPLANIAVAHGQMRETELEKIMLGFLNRDIDVLLSTAIVGSGLDIPSANTIIVDMADRMGLADLYQLKGRVGRGGVRGHAWFLIPGESMITDEARGRLEALQDMSYMGAGFRLAMKDLEIRGAGNMLGPQQSGSIEAVGFDLYMEMLGEAVAEVRGEERPVRVSATVNLRKNAFVPEGYVEDMALRLSIYRSISRAITEEDIREIEDDVTDRFGKPPEEFVGLLTIKRIALEAERHLIREISLSAGSLRFTYAEASDVRAEDIFAAVQRKIKFHPDGFEVRVKGSPTETAVNVLRELGSLLPVKG